MKIPEGYELGNVTPKGALSMLLDKLDFLNENKIPIEIQEDEETVYLFEDKMEQPFAGMPREVWIKFLSTLKK